MKLLQISLIMLMTTTATFSQTPKKSETVSLNGSAVYYEVYGKGTPLFLLHGYTQSSKSWLPFVADYADDFEIYLVDLKGHGKSSPFKQKLSIKSAADDVHALIKYLKLDSIDAIGYSYGGDILFQLELLHPGLVKSMVVIGSCGSWKATDFPHWVEFLSYKNIDNLPWMREQQTSEEQIKSILNQVPNYDVRLNVAELRKIQTRTLIVVGDKDDSLPFDDILSARNNMPNSSLWIVPETGHGAHRDNNKPEFIRISKKFFKPDLTMETNPQQANMATLRKAVQAINDRDFITVQQCMTDNFTRHDLTDAFPAHGSGSGEAINFLQTLMKAVPDVYFDIQDIFAESDRVSVRYQFTGTHKGDLFGIPTTGKKINFSGINIYRFENAKGAEVWQVWDWASVLRQIDVLDVGSEKLKVCEADMLLLRKAVQAVNDRDFTILATYLTDNFQRHDLTSAFPDSEVGSGAGINFVKALLKAFPDVIFNIQDIFSENDRAVIRFQFTGTHKGDLFGIAPTDKKVDFSGVNFYRFENGKIAEVWQVWDWGGVLKQIGVLDIDKFRQK